MFESRAPLIVLASSSSRRATGPQWQRAGRHDIYEDKTSRTNIFANGVTQLDFVRLTNFLAWTSSYLITSGGSYHLRLFSRPSRHPGRERVVRRIWPNVPTAGSITPSTTATVNLRKAAQRRRKRPRCCPAVASPTSTRMREQVTHLPHTTYAKPSHYFTQSNDIYPTFRLYCICPSPCAPIIPLRLYPWPQQQH